MIPRPNLNPKPLNLALPTLNPRLNNRSPTLRLLTPLSRTDTLPKRILHNPILDNRRAHVSDLEDLQAGGVSDSFPHAPRGEQARAVESEDRAFGAGVQEHRVAEVPVVAAH